MSRFIVAMFVVCAFLSTSLSQTKEVKKAEQSKEKTSVQAKEKTVIETKEKVKKEDVKPVVKEEKKDTAKKASSKLVPVKKITTPVTTTPKK